MGQETVVMKLTWAGVFKLWPLWLTIIWMALTVAAWYADFGGDR